MSVCLSVCLFVFFTENFSPKATAQVGVWKTNAMKIYG